MKVSLLKSKLLRVEVTDSSLNYEGSLGIDTDLMDRVGLLPYEKILVANINSGDRFETYAIAAPAGSKTIALNGAAARMGQIGDLLVVLSFAQFSTEEAKEWKPKTITLAEKNSQVVKSINC